MNKKNVFCAFVAVFMLWSSLLLANNRLRLLHPLTIHHWGDAGMRVAYTHNTLRYMFNNGNPLKCALKDYGQAIKTALLPVSTLGRADLWLDKYIEIIDVEPPLSRIASWIEEKELAPYIEFNFPKMPKTFIDTIKLAIVQELSNQDIPLSLLSFIDGNILSCGDNIALASLMPNKERFSAAHRIASFRYSERKKYSGLIFAGDNEICNFEKVYKDQRVIGLNLDNRRSFSKQLTKSGYETVKFQFVFGRRILCCCQSKTPHSTCGGLDLEANDSQVLEFLINVADVLDPAQESLAILTGYYPVEFYDFEADIAEFNRLVPEFEAQILRSEIGEFWGILIHKRTFMNR